MSSKPVITENGYKFRRCQRSDLPQVSDLVNRVFGINFGRDYFEWKYFSAPAGKIVTSVGHCNGELVALMGAIPIKFSICGKTTIGLQEVDVAILEEHRKLPVYLNLINQERRGLINNNIDFTYGITIKNTSNIDETLFRKKKIGPIPRLVKIMDVRPYLESYWPLKMMTPMLSPLINLAMRIRYPVKCMVPQNMQIKQISNFDDRFDRLLERTISDYPIMAIKDADYLNWRYDRDPCMDYNTYCLETVDSREIAGYIVINIKDEIAKRGYIYDLITPKDSDPLITRCLLKHAIMIFLQKKVSAIECWMFNHCHIYKELINNGFIPRIKDGFDLQVQKAPSKQKMLFASAFNSAESWFISRGDSDI